MSVPLTSGGSPAPRSDDLDLTAALVGPAHDAGLTGLTVRYDVRAASRATGNTTLFAEIDAFRLTLQYRPPSVRGQQSQVDGSVGCVAAVPYQPGPGGRNCALLDVSGSADFFLQGGLYAPLAAIDLTAPDQSGCTPGQTARCVLAKAGLVARSIRIDTAGGGGGGEDDEHEGGGSTSGVVVEIPPVSSGPQPLDVYLTAYVCPTGVTCTGTPPSGTGWRKVGTALARYTDRPGRRSAAAGWSRSGPGTCGLSPVARSRTANPSPGPARPGRSGGPGGYPDRRDAECG